MPRAPWRVTALAQPLSLRPACSAQAEAPHVWFSDDSFLSKFLKAFFLSG